MEEKIQWYEEILHLDPSSTLFFSLARLYVQKSDTEKAVDVLLRGIDKHPEHIEARLLLCQLFESMGRLEERDRLIDEVSALFSRYPSFWSGWAEKLQKQGKGDLAAAAFFMAANFGGSSTGWADVLMAGLRAFQSGHSTGSDAEAQEAEAPPASAAPAREPSSPDKGHREASDQDSSSTDGREEIIDLVDEKEDQGVEFLEAEEGEDRASPGEEHEAPTTYRTKTMADILAGQGDYDGALEIYQELLDETSDSTKRRELEERIEAVLQKRSSEVEAMEKASGRGEKSGKKDILQKMERLAERLEARNEVS